MSLSGKGRIQGGDGWLLTSTGSLYAYHDGELTKQGAIGAKRPGTSGPRSGENTVGAEPRQPSTV